MVNINELARRTGYPTDYLTHLKGIHDGTEPDCTEEELKDVQALDEQLASLDLDNE